MDTEKLLKSFALTFFVFLLSSNALAVITDISSILQNLQKIVGPITVVLLSISYVAGIVLIFRGLGLLKAFGMPLTQATRPGEIAGPLVYLIVGAALIYMPSTVEVTSHTFFGRGSKSVVIGGKIQLSALGNAATKILSYAPELGIEKYWQDFVNTIILYVQLIGLLAFIRGWFIIAHSGQPGVQPGSISKGIIHIIGGIIAINFLPVFEILRNTIFN